MKIPHRFAWEVWLEMTDTRCGYKSIMDIVCAINFDKLHDTTPRIIVEHENYFSPLILAYSTENFQIILSDLTDIEKKMKEDCT